MKKAELKKDIKTLTKEYKDQQDDYQRVMDHNKRQSQRIKDLDSALIKYKAGERKMQNTIKGLQEAFIREVERDIKKDKEIHRLEKELRQARGLDFTTHFIEKPGDQVAINFEFANGDTDQGVEVIELFDWPRESVRGAKFAEIRFCPPKLKDYTSGARAYVVPASEGKSHDATRVMTPAGLASSFNKANPNK